MSEFVSGDGSEEFSYGENGGGNVRETTPLTVSASFKGSRRRTAVMRPSLDADEFLNLLHGSDPVKLELNRLENEVRGQSCLARWIQMPDLVLERCRFCYVYIFFLEICD